MGTKKKHVFLVVRLTGAAETLAQGCQSVSARSIYDIQRCIIEPNVKIAESNYLMVRLTSYFGDAEFAGMNRSDEFIWVLKKK